MTGKMATLAGKVATHMSDKWHFVPVMQWDISQMSGIGEGTHEQNRNFHILFSQPQVRFAGLMEP